MQQFEDSNFEPFDKGSYQIEQPLINESDISAIAEQFSPLAYQTPTQTIEQPQTNILDQQSFNYPEQYDTTTTNQMSQYVAEVPPVENNSFQLLLNANETGTISEANTMLEAPTLEDTSYQQGYEVVSDPVPPNYYEVVSDPVPPIETNPIPVDVGQFDGQVVNDVETKQPETVTIVVTSPNGDQVTTQTTPENVQTVINAAQIADDATANQTSDTAANQTSNTAAGNTTGQTEDLLFGYPRESVYLVGGVALLGSLWLLSAFSSEE